MAATIAGVGLAVVEYPLQRLFDDQDRDFGVDGAAPLFAWVAFGTRNAQGEPACVSPVDHTSGGSPTPLAIAPWW